MNLNEITRKIWEETIIANKAMKKKQPKLKNFWWPCWKFMMSEIRHEYLQWTAYLIINDMPAFTAEDRHMQAVTNRIAAGWRLGEERNDSTKSDPYLIPLPKCEDWFQEWCADRDAFMVSILKDNWGNVCL